MGIIIEKEQVRISGPIDFLRGKVNPGGSKSISNRLLIIQQFFQNKHVFENLSVSDDTKVLQQALDNLATTGHIDIGDAGTACRFLIPFLAHRQWKGILTGSQRMKERPIAELIEAMRLLGADIRYEAKVGSLPISFHGMKNKGLNEIVLDSTISSQFVSALLLVAPYFDKGLTLKLSGNTVSASYIRLTLALMEDCGVRCEWKNNEIRVDSGNYKNLPSNIESDWSSSAYWAAWTALLPQSEIEIPFIATESFQADSIVMKYLEGLGLNWDKKGTGIVITGKETNLPQLKEHDFLNCPDLFQTISVIYAAKGIKGMYTGLNTLRSKETDRMEAMKTELAKTGVHLVELPSHLSGKSGKTWWMQDGKAGSYEDWVFDVKGDHRMAMSMSLLASQRNVIINEPLVVNKSYPDYWEDLGRLMP